ncbi:MAG: class I SAM-dependent methyltransferase [Candidatus Hydrogenedentales bacterium]|jgi:hypothetical protein
MKPEINDHGCWIGAGSLPHVHDMGLQVGLCEFLEPELGTSFHGPIVLGGPSVIDLGCGMGDYVRAFRLVGIDARGFDGNPDTFKLSSELCHTLDLAVPYRGVMRYYDWAMCLEVLEHIPKEFEQQALDNIVGFAGIGVITSWATPGQGGSGHFNERPLAYATQQFADRGFELDTDATKRLRECSTRVWFKNNLLVLRRRKTNE